MIILHFDSKCICDFLETFYFYFNLYIGSLIISLVFVGYGMIKANSYGAHAHGIIVNYDEIKQKSIKYMI